MSCSVAQHSAKPCSLSDHHISQQSAAEFNQSLIYSIVALHVVDNKRCWCIQEQLHGNEEAKELSQQLHQQEQRLTQHQQQVNEEEARLARHKLQLQVLPPLLSDLSACVSYKFISYLTTHCHHNLFILVRGYTTWLLRTRTKATGCQQP